jgi:hypothetical protein
VVWGDASGLKAPLADTADVADGLLHSANAADREVALLLLRLQAALGVGLQAVTEKQAAEASRRRGKAHTDAIRRQVAGFLECSRVAANAIRPEQQLIGGGGDGIGFAGVGESKTGRVSVDVRTKIRSLCADMQRAVGSFALRGLRGVVLTMETTGNTLSSSSSHDYAVGAGSNDRVLYRAYVPAASPGSAGAAGSDAVEPRSAYRVTLKSRCDEVAGCVALLVDSEEVVSATLLDMDAMAGGGWSGRGSGAYGGGSTSGSAGLGLGLEALNDIKDLAEAALQLLVRRTSTLLALDKKSRIVATQREEVLKLRQDLDERARLVGVLEDCHAAAERKAVEARADAEDAAAREQALQRVNGTLQRRLSTVQAEKVGILQLNEAMSKELARTIWYDG